MAQAAPFIPKITKPESYKDIVFGLEETRQNINTVQCGGWEDDMTVTVNGTSVTGNIPQPLISDDLPGQKNTNELGDAVSGVGEETTFEYPASALGYQSACDVHETTINEPTLSSIDVKIDSDGNVTVQPGSGNIDINPHEWCLIKNKSKDTPLLCKRLYEALKQIPSLVDPFRPQTCGVPRKYCFDRTSVCTGEQCAQPPPPTFQYIDPTCIEVPGVGTQIITNEQIIAEERSFFRHYANQFDQATIMVQEYDDKPDLKQPPWQLRVECYDYYNDKDPKDIVTGKNDEQCEIIIATPDEQAPETPEWVPGTDAENQSRSQLGTVKPDASTVQESPRPDRDVPDPWKADKDTNLTMIDMEKLRESQKDFDDPNDITRVLGTILPARQQASKTVSKNARTDMIDDSDHRAVADFWEAQQRELLKMVADPEVKLIMPARLFTGLADDDPIFQYVRQVIQQPAGTVEITLKAGLDDLGAAIESLQRIYIAPIQEVRIPILVPLASSAEINARIFDWKQWKQVEEKAGRSDNAGKADALIAKLTEYQTAADRVQLLRGALSKHIVDLYEPQQKIREYFADWYKKNGTLLQQAMERAVQRRELLRIWRLLQRSMLAADACQMVWCSNQRYTLPIYSLLDDWWGDGSAGSARDPAYKPQDLRSLNYQQPKTMVFDFSDMRFPGEPWLVPVLWPVQVRLNLPVPPSFGGDPGTAAAYPSLPNIPDASIFDSFPAPKFTPPAASQITLQATPDLTQAKSILREFRKIVDATPIDQQIQQEQALANGAPIDQEPQFDPTRDSMRGSYCRLAPSVLTPPDPMQLQGYETKIIHNEHELRQIVARLFARWMPERKEDFAGRVARRNQGVQSRECHEDVVCMFLAPEERTTTTWQWFMPSTSAGNFTGLADSLRTSTLPASEERNPYWNASTETLKRIFQRFDLPIEFDLVPTR